MIRVSELKLPIEGNQKALEKKLAKALRVPVEEIKAFDTTFCKFNVSIARDEDDVIIPMIARKSLFDAAPETDDPVRGMLWLQGHCAETLEEKIRTDK